MKLKSLNLLFSTSFTLSDMKDIVFRTIGFCLLFQIFTLNIRKHDSGVDIYDRPKLGLPAEAVDMSVMNSFSVNFHATMISLRNNEAELSASL